MIEQARQVRSAVDRPNVDGMRRVAGGRALARALPALAVLALGAACGVSDAAPTELPTFPVVSTEPSVQTDVRDGLIPDDCEQLLGVADLNAVLGLPLDTVAVRTTIGVAEPSVGRTERVACRYSGTGSGPVHGQRLLDINAAAYTDSDAADRQWRRNADAEDGARRDLPIGSAGAVIVERNEEALLSVVYGPVILTVVLPEQPLPGGRPRAEAVVDLALRVLPAVVTPSPPPSTAPDTGAP